MPVLQQTPNNTYLGNGSATVFAYTFRIPDEESLTVLVDGEEVLSGYSISNVDNNAGGNVTFAVAPPDGVTVRLERTIALARETDYIEGGALPAEVLDRDFDTLVMIAQDVSSKGLKSPMGVSFDAIGQRISNVADPEDDQDAVTKYWAETNGSSHVAQSLTNATSAAASAAAAGASATAAAASASTATTQASTATTQATNAATSATTANTHRVAAELAETNAETAETNAETAQAAAEAAQAAAATSASAAATSATAAAGSATSASTSATAASGSATAAATSATDAATSAASYTTVPLTSFSTARVLALTDAGKGLLHPASDSTARVLTIPTNASVAFATNTVLTVVNYGGTVTITPDSGVTLRQAGVGTSGSRALAQYGIATLLKVDSNDWIVCGPGVT